MTLSDEVGLSVGATKLTAVVVGRTAVTRTPVVTLYPHRPPEVGVPSENPNLTERGLIITDFVDRVGDPVGIVAADGSMHMADKVLADALRAMLYTLGRAPSGPVAVTYPAHWRSAAVDALRNALAAVPELQGAPLLSDAAAALTALQADPGVPTRGVVALCDFGGTGTNITLVDAADNFAPIGPTVRHTDLSGDLIDQALLTHVINDLANAGAIDLSGTSAIGSLGRLRAQCRAAKERLSTSAVTSLVAELPDHRSDVRLTRNELDEMIRAPLADFVGVVQEALQRNRFHAADLVAVASVGGGARIPIITTTLSEQFRVPVITTGQPELTAAIGGGLKAARGAVDEGKTSMAVAPGVAAAAAAATAMAPEVGAQDAPQSTTFRALAWSEADDSPDVEPTDPYDYGGPAAGDGFPAGARPQMQFDHEPDQYEATPLPWYRKPALVLVAGVLALLAALTAAVLFVTRDESTPAPASTNTPVTTTTAPAPPPPPTTTAAAPTPVAPEPPPQTQVPQTRTVTQQAPQPPATVTEAPPPPPETTEAPPPPPPTSEAPPPTTEEPPTSQPPRWRPTAPYPTIPGLPWVPAPHLPGQPAQP